MCGLAHPGGPITMKINNYLFYRLPTTAKEPKLKKTLTKQINMTYNGINIKLFPCLLPEIALLFKKSKIFFYVFFSYKHTHIQYRLTVAHMPTETFHHCPATLTLK